MTRILIADDNEQNLYLLHVLLTGYGYEVVSAENGARALEMARRDPPDMIITDILMPVMDGSRSFFTPPRIPIPKMRRLRWGWGRIDSSSNPPNRTC